ncbi:cytochrome C oxidase subunit IV family protein [Thalassomonas viridans]|uniref:Cytochrome C oxidase subunit IV family protein n=1 Tax=Thalassomonas viridans TaxID=137584 RepID=A0AAF0C9D1_9GAMM|nr:cytochrome C oxidase subunit IV family protein [Thalassomonas viridans]WDE05115.1 cytochrome C oxidase subunit IV family protein [Thalassomonas viridans]
MLSKFRQSRGIHIALVLLLAFTLLSLGLSRYYPASWYLSCVLVLLTIIKGQQITDVFMELRHAPANWRLFLLAYVVIIPVLLGVILYL